ncbi:MAG: GNAT family protein, partial [Pseudomonadota bacterium]
AVDAVVASVFLDNPASARVLAKLGFVESGRGAGWSRARGDSAIPEVRMRLTREQWQAVSRPASGDDGAS